MGCDIHAWIEWDEWGPEAEKWDFGQVDLGRNYFLFALMANVRNNNDVTPVAMPKGLPDRLSPSVRHEHEEMDGDAHGASWLDIPELEEVRRRYESANPEGAHKPLRACLAAMRELPGSRLVFWFDN